MVANIEVLSNSCFSLSMCQKVFSISVKNWKDLVHCFSSSSSFFLLLVSGFKHHFTSEVFWIHSHLHLQTTTTTTITTKCKRGRPHTLHTRTHTLWPLLLQHEMWGNYLFIGVAFGAQEQNMKHLFRKWWSWAAVLFSSHRKHGSNLSVPEFMRFDYTWLDTETMNKFMFFCIHNLQMTAGFS